MEEKKNFLKKGQSMEEDEKNKQSAEIAFRNQKALFNKKGYVFKTSVEDQEFNNVFQAHWLRKDLTGRLKEGEFTGNPSLVKNMEKGVLAVYEEIMGEIGKLSEHINKNSSKWERANLLQEELKQLAETLEKQQQAVWGYIEAAYRREDGSFEEIQQDPVYQSGLGKLYRLEKEMKLLELRLSAPDLAVSREEEDYLYEKLDSLEKENAPFENYLRVDARRN